MQQKTEITTSRVTTDYEWSADKDDWVPVHKSATTETETVVRSD